MRRSGAFPRALLTCFALSVAVAGVQPATADVEVESDTIVRYFERDTSEGDDQAVAPAYEYLRLSAGALEEHGLSFHAYGWGRYDLAGNEFFEDRSQGELLYGYLQFTREDANFAARLGRQYVFAGVSNESLDGLSIHTDLTPLFTLSAYGGLPVSLEEVKGRDGDRIYGGRLAHHGGRLYEIGLSYKRVDNDGEKEEEVLGIDTALSLGTFAYLHGTSVRNLETDDWQEHSYEARIPLEEFTLRPYFEYFEYDSYFDTGANTGSPFLLLADSDEALTIVGGDLNWKPTYEIELGARVKHFDYDERDDGAWYYAGLATWHLDLLSRVGVEAGRMDGDTDDSAYNQLRGFFYHEADPHFLSGDLVYVRYDEDILDEDRSLYASLSAGTRLLDETLEVSLSADYGVDPYFDRDVRGLVNVRYLFSL